MSKTVVIIGGGPGGMATASRVKRLKPEYNVIVFEKTRWVSFALCGTPYYVGGVVKKIEHLMHYKPEYFIKNRGIDLRIRHKVESIDPNTRTVEYVNLETGEKGKVEYDYLVIATGARPRAYDFFPEIKDIEGVFTLSHLDDAEKLRNYIEKLGSGKKAVVVGAGYIGLEVAEALAEKGFKVTVSEMFDQVLPKAIDPDFAKTIQEHLRSHGVEVLLGAKTTGFKADEKGRLVGIETDKGFLEADVAVVGVGIRPNTELAQMVRAKIGQTRAVWTDEHTETSVKGVYAVGDVAETTHLVTRERIWAAFATNANKMGYVAGTNIGGRKAAYKGTALTAATQIFGLVVARTGLGEEEAKKKGYNVVAVALRSNSRPAYMGDVEVVRFKVIADADTGKLLGAQAIGDQSAFWRVNVIAALLEREGTVWDLFQTDVGYHPYLNPVWDPIIVAGRLFQRQLGETPKKA